MQAIADISELGNALRSARKSQGLTQEQLAAACGVGRRFIVDLESGKPTCQLGKALSVLSTLGLSVHLASRGDDLP
ncbi:transcriptional regulator, y4mF family [Methylomagnum ishizawai]|uniref:Transcriptional regulator, y4mF family n=1 Tax=Methylomagnum ishizawai TaxID=1760988 RepID=A0A1Y6CUQ8_9GAMM|nr:helix-turn-helix transcriptional regulator [Methylomagnum ishizawai]SMF94389.1 transcriptional regulator, y4mF family [Methylomagnum ishizawai]